MSKNEQKLVLDPPLELHFKAPFHDVTTSYLKLTNPTDRPICFKVKTTAPKTYCVRPNSGIVLPKKSVSVAVMLQPLDLESADKSRHKFMVQSVFAPEGEFSQESLWRDTPPEEFMNSKLKCVFISENAEIAPKIEPHKVENETVPVVQHYTPKVTPACKEFILLKREEENEKLKEELNQLRIENSALKEEGLRSRMAYDARTRGTLAKLVETDHHKSDKQQELIFNNTFILVSVIVFLIGMFFGKYVV